MSDTTTPTPATKPWWASKTLIFNVIAGIATLAGVFKLDLGLDQATQATIGAGLIAMLNIGLRLITKSAVTIS